MRKTCTVKWQAFRSEAWDSVKSFVSFVTSSHIIVGILILLFFLIIREKFQVFKMYFPYIEVELELPVAVKDWFFSACHQIQKLTIQ